MSLFDYFSDRRYRQHRIALALLLPFTCAVLIGLVILLYFQQRETLALAHATQEESSVQMAPPDVLARIDSAVRAYAVGNTAEARKQLADVNLERAASPSAWVIAGLLKESERNYDAALDLYSRGITATPDISLFYRRASLYRTVGKYEAALQDLDRARYLDPGDILVSNERLLLLVQLDREQQAVGEIEYLQKNSSGIDDSNWIFGQVGIALKHGDYIKAQELLNRAKSSVDSAIFSQMLKNPAIVRYQIQPEILPFYTSTPAP